jgi:tetratricopeptide (TPR) repeat protein
MPPKSARAPRAPRTTSRSGGAATHAGNRYELIYAIQEVFGLIGEQYKHPVPPLAIRMQPRPDGTGWDLGFEGQERVLEVKSRPSRQDIEDWLDRTALTPLTVQSELVFGRGSSLVTQMVTLVRLAREVASDAEFAAGMANESLPHGAELLARLGPNPREQLRRMKLNDFPEGRVDEVAATAPAYAGEDATRLYTFLYDRLARAASARERLEISSLVREIIGQGIALVEPAYTASDLPPLERRVLCVLQELPNPLCGELIKPLFEVEEGVVATMASRSLLLRGEQGYKMLPIVTRLRHPDRLTILADVLTTLVSSLRNARADLVRSQAANLIELMRALRAHRPLLVAKVFWDLDKTLKESGSKGDVLMIARESISAAKQLPRDQEQVRAEAVALLCGTSWVYQRTQRLIEARADAERSLQLGESLGWKRNSAFYYKCAGRLARMQAEDADINERPKLLRESVELLHKSIETFPEVDGLDPTERREQLGECYALLARTYFIARKEQETIRAIESAAQMVVQGKKAWLDLQILEAELLMRRNEADAAERSCAETLAKMPKDGREISEMRVRLLEVYAGALWRTGQKGAARSRLAEAVEISDKLGDLRATARVNWKAMLSSGRVLDNDRTELSREADVRVRVRAFELHQQALAEASVGAVGKRAGNGMGAAYWSPLLAQARMAVAVDGDPWE